MVVLIPFVGFVVHPGVVAQRCQRNVVDEGGYSLRLFTVLKKIIIGND
jgi:hypothetical protein